MATIAHDPKIIPAVIPPIVAVSTDVGMKVIYIGSSASGLIEVNAGGDLLFTHGVAGSEAADTGIGVAGTIDLSTPAAGYDTMGEVVDAINISSNWRAVLWGSLRANLTDNRFITMAATQARQVAVDLLHDTTTVGAASTYIIGQRISRSNLIGRNDAGYQNACALIEGVYTAAAQVAVIRAYSVNELTKVETLIWASSGAALASGTAFEFNDVDFGSLGAIYANPNEALVVQVQVPNGAAYTAPRLNIQGFHKLLGGNSKGVANAYISRQ